MSTQVNRNEIQELLHKALNCVGGIDVSSLNQYALDSKNQAADLIRKAMDLVKEPRQCLLNDGLYDIGNLKVHFHDDNRASITCYRRMVNSKRYTWVVSLGLFERLRGVTLEEKVIGAKLKAVSWMQAENAKIVKRNETQKRLNGRS